MEFKKYKLNEIAQFSQGKQVDVKEQYEKKENGMKRFVRIVDYTNVNEPIRYVKDYGERYYASEKELVMIRYGSQTAGMVAMGKNGIIANNMFKINLDNSVVLNKYMYYYLSQKEIFNFLKNSQSSSTMPAISFSMLNNFEVSIPSIIIQRKVINVLEKIDDKIEVNNQINDNLLEQAKLIYKEWFINFNYLKNGIKNKNELENTTYGLLPKGWTFKTISEMNLDISDGNYSNKYPTKKEFQNQGIPFIRGTDFNGLSISRKNLMYISPEKHEILKKGHLKKDDILITTRGEIGRIAFVSDFFIDSNINAQLIRINGGTKYPMSFLGMSLLSDYAQKDIQSLVTGTALQQLPVGKFNQIKLIIPDDDSIIKEFDNIVGTILKKIQANEDQNEILEQLRDTLLPKLMNGEIDLDKIEI